MVSANVAVVCAVAAFKVNQYGLSTKRLLMIFRWKSDTAAIAQLPPVSGCKSHHVDSVICPIFAR